MKSSNSYGFTISEHNFKLMTEKYIHTPFVQTAQKTTTGF